MSNLSKQLQRALQKFEEFLAANKLRRTAERTAILEAVFEIDESFTIEQLDAYLNESRFHVSRATLYATTDLLVRANLLIRHPAPMASTLYQRIPDEGTRLFLICNSCHKVKNVDTKDVLAIIDGIPVKRFNPTHRIAYIYGLCTRCKTKQRRQLAKIQDKRK